MNHLYQINQSKVGKFSRYLFIFFLVTTMMVSQLSLSFLSTPAFAEDEENQAIENHIPLEDLEIEPSEEEPIDEPDEELDITQEEQEEEENQAEEENPLEALEMGALALIEPPTGSYKAEGTKTPPYKAHVNWNDDLDTSGRTSPLNLQILYHVDEHMISTQYEPLTVKVLEDLEITELDAISILTTPTPTEDANTWDYLFDQLPKEIVHYDGNGDIIDKFPIKYSFEIIDPSMTAVDANYIIGETKDSLDHNSSTIMLTKKKDATFNLEWKDASGEYDSRPTTDELLPQLIFECTDGKVTKEITVNSDDVVIMPSGEIIFHNLPAYDPDGVPLRYSLKIPENKLDISNNSEFPSGLVDDTVKYDSTYKNIGTYAEVSDRCYEGGTISNLLTDEIEFDGEKIWQDGDTNPEDRPTATFYLWRYPAVDDADYQTASQVPNMSITLDAGTNPFKIKFPTTEGEKLPRFNYEGAEYVYFVKEVLDGANSGAYTQIFDNIPDVVPAGSEDAKVLFAGGDINNRLDEKINIPFTKTWKNAARQYLNAAIKVKVERRKKGSTENFVPVASVGTDGVEVIDGFRAEVMEKTTTFAGLDKFDVNGYEYEYKITEVGAWVGTGATPAANDNAWTIVSEKVDGSAEYITADGYSYELTTTIDSKTGEVSKTNKLVGDADVRIKKIWTGGNPETEYSTVYMDIRRDGKALTLDELKDFYRSGVEVTFGGITRTVELDTGKGLLYITPAEADTGNWLEATGFPRYDEQGREYTYSVREQSVPNAHVEYSTIRTEGINLDESKTSVVETTVTNIIGNTGKEIEVEKHWLDDGDEHCRGTVTVGVFRIGDDINPIANGTLSEANEWTAWIGLPDDGTPLSNYYVREISITTSADTYNVSGNGNPFLSYTPGNPEPNYVSAGEVTTNNHSYDVKIARDSKAYKYDIKNIRKGTVDITVIKDWNDNNYHEDAVYKQSATFEIRQRGNYDPVGTYFSNTIEITLDGNTDSVETTAWEATKIDLPKYDDEGVLIVYDVVETKITIPNGSGGTITIPVNSGSYTIDDGANHGKGSTYSVDVIAEREYGEHPSPSPGYLPIADEYTFTVKNTRHDTVDFVVHKLWRDITRVKGIATDVDEAMEAKTRPNIYLTLYSQVEDENETSGWTEWEEVEDYVDRIWTYDGSNGNNEYYWTCTFNSLPKYDAGGNLIKYGAVESSHAILGYYTEYWSGPPTIIDAEPDKTMLSKVTDVDIYKPTGSKIWDSRNPSTPTPDLDNDEIVLFDGTILNGREDTRTLAGQKVWKNVPASIVSSGNVPSVELELQNYVFSGSDFEFEDVSGVSKITLNPGDRYFEFTTYITTDDDKFPKYDEDYGIFIKYRAKEVNSPPLTGYGAPIYDDYNLIVENVYETEGAIDIEFTKNWDFSALGSAAPDPGSVQAAKFELWRKLYKPDETTLIIDEHVANKNPIFIPYKDRLEIFKFENLPKIGYNEQPFHYYLKETSEHGFKSSISADQDTGDNYKFEVINTYTGGPHIKLGGTKAWDDNQAVLATRPSDLEIKVYRSETDIPLADVKTKATDITSDVDIVWSDKTTDNWTYDITAKTAISGDPIEAGAGKASLYQFAPSAKRYIYYIEEVDPGKNYKSTALIIKASGSSTDLKSHFKNTLEMTSITATKVWDDYYNEYGTRPESITFTLQYKDSAGNFIDMKDTNNAVMKKVLVIGSAPFPAPGSQTVTFNKMPKYDLNDDLYEYRIIETAAYTDSLGTITFTPDSSNPAKGTFEYVDNGVNIKYSFDAIADDDYNTKITNKLSDERISLSGSKSWMDDSDKYSVRPKNLDLTVYRRVENTTNWVEFTGDYNIVWDYNSGANKWTYTIPELPRYVFNITTPTLWEYAVKESTPLYYHQTDGSVDGYVQGTTTPADQGHIKNANLENSIVYDDVLSVTKEKDRGPKEMEFSFNIFVSDKPITDANKGMLYKGNYEVFSKAESATTPKAPYKTLDGIITIKADEKFIIREIPQGFYYNVVELKHDDYALDVSKSTPLKGSIDDYALGSGIIEETAYNAAESILAIVNTTKNPGIGESKLHNAGGKVEVITDDSDPNVNPDQSSEDDYKLNKTAVVWTPNLYWTFGDTITIYYREFGETEEKSLTLSNYLDSNGDLKNLADCVASDQIAFQRFLNAGATLSMQQNGSVKLKLATNVDDMPAQTRVEVDFLPTLAVHNITPGNPGGTVNVQGGKVSELADGVPTYGGNPYSKVASVFGTAATGYMVEPTKFALRNMNDVNGTSYPVTLNADGTFTTIIQTMIDGTLEDVEITGLAIFEYDENGNPINVRIDIDNLKIPMHVDILFIPIPDNTTPEEKGDGSLNKKSSSVNRDVKTGDNTQLTVYAIVIIVALGILTTLIWTSLRRRKSLPK